MKNKLMKNVMMVAVALLTFFATNAAASACIWGVYQPEEPKSLQEK